jgi:hypothetical protein
MNKAKTTRVHTSHVGILALPKPESGFMSIDYVIYTFLPAISRNRGMRILRK